MADANKPGLAPGKQGAVTTERKKIGCFHCCINDLSPGSTFMSASTFCQGPCCDLELALMRLPFLVDVLCCISPPAFLSSFLLCAEHGSSCGHRAVEHAQPFDCLT